MSDHKTVTFDASHRALIERAAKIIQAGADSLKEAHCLNGDWRDSDLARRDYYDELAVVGQLCAMLASSQSADHSGEATEKVDHVADVRNMVAAQSAGQETTATAECWCETCQPSVGLNTRMVLCATCGNKRCPHATDCRLACTNSNESGQWGSSYGTRVIAAPVNGGERDTVEVAIALEQQRTLAIVKAVRDINFGESPTGMPTPASAAYDLACEEIERRMRTEQWELDGAAAPLPSAERAADAQQVGGVRYERVDGCKDCRHAHYYSADRCECLKEKRMFDALGRPNVAPDWCPLPALTSPAKVGGDEREAYIASLPADWHKDSSLETWFPLTAEELAATKRMFGEACTDLGRVNKALGLDPDDAGAEPIIDAIDELKARAALSADGGEDKRDAGRYRWLRKRYIGFDFDWMADNDGNNGKQVICFQMDSGMRIGVDINDAIDAAIAANQARKGDA